jgi:hypothetical protein
MAELARDELVANLKRYVISQNDINSFCANRLSGSLLASGDYSDLIITCGTDTYKVHKSVVCSQSGFFKRAERFSVGKVGGFSIRILAKGLANNDERVGGCRKQDRSTRRRPDYYQRIDSLPVRKRV